ncbi:RNA methyltransferase, TrmA family [Lachnospiraceae bacterium TWA4]|nr:RNA methyltransferase, TrmA family [Lachnospiraceae bacterium TWA4]
MKKGEIYEAVVETSVFPDKGIVTIGDRKVAIKQALPGQKNSFSIKKVKKGKTEGRLLEVLEPSSLETKENVCKHYGICGSCIYQSIPYEEQLKIKEKQSLKLLGPVKEAYGIAADYEGVKPNPSPDGYRNKMEFTFGDEVKDGDLALGMHKRGSFYDIVTVSDCRIVHDDFKKVLVNTLEFFKERNISYYHRMRHEGYLRHLLVRRTTKTGQLMVDLVTSSQCPVDEEVLLNDYTKMLTSLDYEAELVSVLHTTNDSLADVVKNERTDLLYSRDYIEEELLGLTFKITPFSFFQTNSLGAEVLYETAREYIGSIDGANIFDLYSGTGTIAQILAPVAKHVTGVEIVEEAVEAAKENAKRNGLDNCDFIAGDVLKVLDDLEEKPDFIILDPPREGIHPKALQKIIGYGVERMVYISCKPTSLMRDLEVFLQNGYQVERICGVDLFTGTGHVETVCLLINQNAKAKHHVNVGLDVEDYYRIKERN